MAYTVCEPCVDCKYTDCVTVCPVECFYEADNFTLTVGGEERQIQGTLFIHPDECIDCGACVPECPVQAIFPNEEVPEEWTEWCDINAAETTGENEEKWPKIIEKKDPLGEPK